MEKGEECTIQMVERCVRNTVNSFDPMFEGILSLLPERQKEVIYAIAKEGKAKAVTSSSFVRKHGLKSPSTVQSALRQLLEKEFITRENDVYIVYDRFFGLWLAEKKIHIMTKKRDSLIFEAISSFYYPRLPRTLLIFYQDSIRRT